ncbi:MAG: c-type cytochrome [Elusimicrobiota bacterium]
MLRSESQRLTPVLLAAALLASALAASAQEGAVEDFRQNCYSCHTIGGGRLTGPDLKDVSKRRQKAWILNFVSGPKKAMDSGDADAIRLRDEFRGVIMPDISGMTPARAETLLALIDAESKAEKSRFKGASLIDRPLTPADVDSGRALFTGRVRLKNGAPTCVSCHSIGGLRGLFGGGGLGPDLTDSVSRLGGDKALAAWLAAPVTPTMKPLFQSRPIHETEILPLTAYLKDAGEKHRPAGVQNRLLFLITGVAGALFLLLVFDSAWSHRLRSVRRRMVARAREPEERDE